MSDAITHGNAINEACSGALFCFDICGRQELNFDELRYALFLRVKNIIHASEQYFTLCIMLRNFLFLIFSPLTIIT